MTNSSADFLASESKNEDALLTDLKAMVIAHDHSHPRHNQIALGPSQVGHPCARNVISGLLADTSSVINPRGDVLPSYIGVAAHKAMEEAAKLDNERLLKEIGENWSLISGFPLPRWLTETKVTVREGLTGTCDLYDTWTNTVIDYKFPGTTAMTEYRKNGPSPIYESQAFLYGRGYQNAGYPVDRVGIWFIPRAGRLSGSFLWIRPYDDTRVDSILKRLDDMIVLIDELQIEQHPERLALIPLTPYQCTWCPWFAINPERHGVNPYACAGGAAYRPLITNHSGMTGPIEVAK
jgi:hypothetical protein